MKTTVGKIEKSLPEGFRIDPEMKRYEYGPGFLEKKKHAEELIKKYGLPPRKPKQ